MIPEALVVTNSLYALDGGSILLRVLDPATSCSHEVELEHHRLPVKNGPSNRPLGGLLFDGDLLPVRGPDERSLVRALRAAHIEPKRDVPDDVVADSGNRIVFGRDLEEYFEQIAEGPQAAIRALIEQLVSFVESDEYAAVARRCARTV